MGLVNCMHTTEDLAISGTIKGFTEYTNYLSWTENWKANLDFLQDIISVGKTRVDQSKLLNEFHEW